MSTSGYKMMLTVALILVVGVGASGAARADDFGKFLLGAAVGVLAYKALTDDNDCHQRYYCPPPCPPVVVRVPRSWDCAPYDRYCPPPSYGYYAPAPRVVYPQRAYAQGYGYSYRDGRDRDRHDGYRH